MLLMHRRPFRPDRSLDSVSLRLGGWFEAHATGRGIIAIPIVALALALVAGVKLWLVG